MTDAERAAQARMLLETPLFVEILSRLEQSAVDICINAGPSEHEKRADWAAEARAVRRLRERLNDYAKSETWKAPKVA